jgi:chitosanase
VTSPEDGGTPPLTYAATNWVDGVTQVSADRLNNVEGGVSLGYAALNDHDDRLDALEAAPARTSPINPNSKGPSSARPAATLGTYYYDTTLGKPIWANGSGWVDYLGAALGGSGGSNAPQGFSAVTQPNNTVVCTWNPVAGATSYKVYEAQFTSGVPGATALVANTFTYTPAPPATAQQIVQEKCFEITSTAENSTVQWGLQYTYIEDIGDTRGYTGGLVGFTSATGDMLDVVKNWNTVAPGNILAKYISKLTTCASVGMGSKASSTAASQLGSAYIADWHAASTDPVWQKVQRDYRESVYWAPAYNAAIADGLSPLGQALYYDTSVNHGPGVVNSGDGSFDDIRSRTTGTKPKNGGSETTWLNNFINLRSAILSSPDWNDNPPDGRITMFKAFVTGGKFQLPTPLTWSIYGDSFTMATDPPPPDLVTITNRTYEFWVTATVGGVESAASNHVTAKVPLGS